MRVFTPEEARTYRCCQIDQYCVGVNCMAWKSYKVIDPTHTGTSQKISWYGKMGALSPPPPTVDSGMGYCGLVE